MSGLIVIVDDFSFIALSGQRARRCSHARWTVQARRKRVQGVHSLSTEYDGLRHACFRPLHPDLLRIHFYLCKDGAHLLTEFAAQDVLLRVDFQRHMLADVFFGDFVWGLGYKARLQGCAAGNEKSWHPGLSNSLGYKARLQG